MDQLILSTRLSNIFLKLFNYLWFFIKLVFFSAIFAIPFVFVVNWLKNPFSKIREKRNYIVSLFFLTYVVLFIFLIIYFVFLIINTGLPVSGYYLILFFLYSIFRLLVVNLLLTAIVVIFEMITTLIYEKLNKRHYNKKGKLSKAIKQSLNFVDLWISLTITFICVFFVYLLFPKIIAILLYLILI